MHYSWIYAIHIPHINSHEYSHSLYVLNYIFLDLLMLIYEKAIDYMFVIRLNKLWHGFIDLIVFQLIPGVFYCRQCQCLSIMTTSYFFLNHRAVDWGDKEWVDKSVSQSNQWKMIFKITNTFLIPKQNQESENRNNHTLEKM